MMHDSDSSPNSANSPAPKPPPSVDNFVTWSEIEQKIRHVAQPQARPSTSPSNWRWGWVVIPIMLGVSRLLSGGARHSDPPVYHPPNPQFERNQIELFLHEANPPQDIPAGQFGGALEEIPKAKNAKEPDGPPKP